MNIYVGWSFWGGLLELANLPIYLFNKHFVHSYPRKTRDYRFLPRTSKYSPFWSRGLWRWICKITATLLELAVKSLLSSEPAVMHALEKIPRDLFVPLFSTAFLGGYKKIQAMVRGLPFYRLHLGSLKAQESYHDILEAMIDGLPIPQPRTFFL